MKLRTMLATLAILTLAIVSTGCDTMPVADQYRSSAANSISIQRVGGSANIASVSAGPGVASERFCRGVGTVSIDPNRNLIEYIENALLEEMFAARAFDATSPSGISVVVTELTHTTMAGANWTVGLAVSSTTSSTTITSRTVYPFKTSFTGVVACKNLADAYAGAVSTALRSIFTDPQFGELLNPTSASISQPISIN